jgi:hypothetical protein
VTLIIGNVVFDCSSSVDVGIKTQDSRPHVTVRNAGVQISRFDIKLRGGASWFCYNEKC